MFSEIQRLQQSSSCDFPMRTIMSSLPDVVVADVKFDLPDVLLQAETVSMEIVRRLPMFGLQLCHGIGDPPISC